MKKITMTDTTVEKAVAKGLIKLKVSKDDVLITVLEEGKKGLFGFGQKNAVVELLVKEDQAPAGEAEEPAALTEQEGPVESQLQLESASPLEEKSPSHLDQASASSEEATSPTAESTRAKANSKKPSKDSGRFKEVVDYLQAVMESYGATGTISVKETSKKIIFQIDSEKVGLLIGKHGKIINALQVLAQTLVYRIDEKAPMVILNIGDYRQKREEKLKEIADRTAKKVLKTKQAVFLEPLPAFERKVIHARLSKYDHISTHSEGKEPYRYLVVDFVE